MKNCQKTLREKLLKKSVSYSLPQNLERRQNARLVIREMHLELLASQALALKEKLYMILESYSNNLITRCKEIVAGLPSDFVDSENFLVAIGGKKRHNSNSEPYFWETATHMLTNLNQTWEINEIGQIANLTQIIEFREDDDNYEKPPKNHKSGIYWNCTSLCNIRKNSIQRLVENFKIIASCKESNIVALFCAIDSCYFRPVYGKNEEQKAQKIGHPIFCLENERCSSILRLLRELSPHYSGLREILKPFYRVREAAANYSKINSAIETCDINELQETLEEFADLQDSSKKGGTVHEIENEGSNDDYALTDEGHLRNYFEKSLANCFMDIQQFHDTCCSSCERLYQKKKLKLVENVISKCKFEENEAFNTLIAAWLMQFPNKSDTELFEELYLCEFCSKSLVNKKVPARCFLNGSQTDPVPDEIKNLNLFEKILIQKAKAFQTVVRLGTKMKTVNHSGLAKAIKGKILYLPMPLQSNANIIPPNLPPDHELMILVNGQPTKNKVVWQNLVSLGKVRKALIELKEINHLYRDIDIEQCSMDYICGRNINNAENFEVRSQPQSILQKLSEAEKENLYAHYSVHPVNSKNPADLFEAFQMKRVEGEALSNFEKNLDILCFPDLFPTGDYGKHSDRPFGPLADADYVASRIMNKDRRFSLNEQYLFHCFYESEIKTLSGSINYMLRMTKNAPVSVFNLMQGFEAKDKDLESNLAGFMSNMKGTQEYFIKRRGELKTMMHEFGAPTWFITLSCAEYDWLDLHEHIRKFHTNPSGMTANELCASDPVSVVLHYHNRFQSVFRNLIMDKENPCLGKVDNYFWRVEYQGRGAPHYHFVLWIKDAPKIGKSSKEEIIAFILKHVTCGIPDPIKSPTLYQYVTRYQIHKHNSTCLRKQKTKNGFTTRCRFKFPRPVSSEAKLNELHSTIRDYKCSKSTRRLYVLPRKSCEIFVNDYNPVLLLAMACNMDIQFIGDNEMAIATYVTSYMTKKEKSDQIDLWNELGDKNACSRLWTLGFKKLTHRECGAYEVADRLLGHHLYEKSASVLFINTGKKENRLRMLKKKVDLQKLKETNPRSTNIHMTSMVDDIYPSRPDQLENWSLYDFARYWYRSYGKKKQENSIELKNGLGYLNKRVKPFLIQHTRHDPDKSDSERENYYRVLLMLFLPFRNESELLGSHKNFQDSFQYHLPQLNSMMTYHEKLTAIREGQKKLEEKLAEPSNSDIDNQNLDDVENTFQGQDNNQLENAMREIQAAMSGNFNCSVENLLDHISKLQKDQLDIFDKVRNHFSIDDLDKNLLLFVSGCGGFGKSFLIKAIQMFVCQKYNEPLSVALAAPTGLAALNIGGMTLHRLLMLPVEHGKTAAYKKLDPAKHQIMRNTLGKMKVLIIDEVSMVSSLIFAYIHLRLCEITGYDDKPFGGVSVIVFGDLLQLQPVKGDPPFSELSHMEARLQIGSIGSVNLWRDQFEYDELTINKRQKNDLAYGELLGRVRTEDTTIEDITLLKTRIIPNAVDIKAVAEHYSNLVKAGKSPVCLLPTNKKCQEINEIMVDKCGTRKIELLAIDSVPGIPELTQVMKRQIKKLEGKASETAGLESRLVLCENARIMLRRNLCMEKGFVNGSLGTVKQFKMDFEGNVKSVKILFDNGLEEYIERTDVKFEMIKNVYMRRSQFPIVLAYGITIHKSQGMTLDCAIIDIGPTTFQSGQAYVALSRVSSLEGVHLLDFTVTSIWADRRAVVEYNRLRSLYRNDLPQIKVKPPRKQNRSKGSCNVNLFSGLETDSAQVCKTNIAKKKTLPTSQQLPPIFKETKGFINDDNSCYAASVLQVLLKIPEFVDSIKGSIFNPGPTTRALQNLISQLENSDISFLRTTEVRQTLNERFRNTSQEDPTEFLDNLLTNLHEENVTISNSFLHKTQYHEICTECGQGRELYTNPTTGKVFIVNLPHSYENSYNPVDFKDLIESFEPVDQQCLQCKTLSKQRRMLLHSAGKYLILSFARFSYYRTNDTLTYFKIHSPVKNFTTNKVTINGVNFKTIGAILHIGEQINHGHYFSAVKKYDKGWLVCNDQNIANRDNFFPNLKNVYVLILERI